MRGDCVLEGTVCGGRGTVCGGTVCGGTVCWGD